MTNTAPSFPPGWYAVPDRANTKGYWDGASWTGDYAPSDGFTNEGAGGLVALGYITAVIMPLIGFILGIVVATRPNKATSKHGATIIVLSIVAFIVYVAIIAHSASTQTVSY